MVTFISFIHVIVISKLWRLLSIFISHLLLHEDCCVHLLELHLNMGTHTYFMTLPFTILTTDPKWVFHAAVLSCRTKSDSSVVIYSLNVTKFGHLIPVSIEERTTEQIHETESLSPLTIHTSFGSFTDNTRGYFASGVETVKKMRKCQKWVKCPRVLCVIPWDKKYIYITPLHYFFCHLALFYLMSGFKPGCYNAKRLLPCNTLSYFARSFVLIW